MGCISKALWAAPIDPGYAKQSHVDLPEIFECSLAGFVGRFDDIARRCKGEHRLELPKPAYSIGLAYRARIFFKVVFAVLYNITQFYLIAVD